MGRVCEEGQDGAGQRSRTNQESSRIYATIEGREPPVSEITESRVSRKKGLGWIGWFVSIGIQKPM